MADAKPAAGVTYRLKNIAPNMGIRILQPRNPIDRKAQLRTMLLRFPVMNKTPIKLTAIISALCKHKIVLSAASGLIIFL